MKRKHIENQWNKNYPRYQFFVERKIKILHNEHYQYTSSKCSCKAGVKTYLNILYRYDNLTEKVQVFQCNNETKEGKWIDFQCSFSKKPWLFC